MTNPTTPLIYLDDFARANFKTYNDWTPIVAAALASFDHLQDDTVISPGGTLVFGPGPGNAPLTDGVYNFLTPAIPGLPQGFGIEINRVVNMIGNGQLRTRLVFALGLGGIRFNYIGYPETAAGAQSGLLAAQGSSLSEVQLVGNNDAAKPVAPNAHGVYANCLILLRRVSISNFSGHGIYLHGSTGDVPETGTDFSSVEYCGSFFNAGSGLYIEGHDANGVMSFQSAYKQNAVGITDTSLTGATIVGGQLEANSLDLMTNQASAATTFLGCYKESGEPVTMHGNNVVIGGPLATDLLNNPSINSGTSGQPTVIGGAGVMSFARVLAGTKTGAVSLGSANVASDGLLALTDMRGGGSLGFSFSSHANGGIMVDYAGTAYPIFGFINSRCTIANGFPCNAASIPDFANGGVDAGCHLIGDVNHKIFVGVANAKPTSTAYPAGSIMHNNAAVKVGDPTLWKLVSRAGVLQWVVGATLQS